MPSSVPRPWADSKEGQRGQHKIWICLVFCISSPQPWLLFLLASFLLFDYFNGEVRLENREGIWWAWVRGEGGPFSSASRGLIFSCCAFFLTMMFPTSPWFQLLSLDTRYLNFKTRFAAMPCKVGPFSHQALTILLNPITVTQFFFLTMMFPILFLRSWWFYIDPRVSGNYFSYKKFLKCNGLGTRDLPSF